MHKSLLSGMLAALLAGGTAPALAAAPVIDVYKTPACGCCKAWVDHLKQNGFSVRAIDVPDTAGYRKKFGIPEHLGSCHTGVVRGYAIEGHVPAADIRRLLAQKPKATGLAVPGMPMGSPGMEGPRAQPYAVLLVDKKGGYRTYREVPAR